MVWLRELNTDVQAESLKSIYDYREIPWDTVCWWNTSFAEMSKELWRIRNGDAIAYDYIGDDLRGALAGTQRMQWYNAFLERLPKDETTMVDALFTSVKHILLANADAAGKNFLLYDCEQGIWIEEGGAPLKNGETVTGAVMSIVTDFIRAIERGRLLLQEFCNIAAPDPGPKPAAQAGAVAINAWQTMANIRKDAMKPVEKIEKFCNDVLDGKYRNVLSSLRAKSAVPINTWDSNMDWIIAEDGAICLSTIGKDRKETAQLEPWFPETMSTFKVHAQLLPYATSDFYSRWHTGLDKVLPNEKVRRYLQKRYGAALLGKPGQVGKSLVWQYGMGDTAKSSIQECIAGKNGVFAPYAITTESSILTRAGERTGAAERFKAYARGKRYALINELDDGERISQSILKSLTGGDTVTGTAKYANAVEYSFSATLFISSNHPPTLPPGDIAAAKRIHVVPFTHKLWLRSKNPEEWEAAPPEHRADENWVEDILTTELERSAILNWVIDGLTFFIREGLGELPEEMIQANEEFSSEADPISTLVKSLLGEEGFEDRPWIKIYKPNEWMWNGFTNDDALTVQEFRTLLIMRANELRLVKPGEELSQTSMRNAGHMLDDMGGARKKVKVGGKSYWAFTLVRLQPAAAGYI